MNVCNPHFKTAVLFNVIQIGSLDLQNYNFAFCRHLRLGGSLWKDARRRSIHQLQKRVRRELYKQQ